MIQYWLISASALVAIAATNPAAAQSQNSAEFHPAEFCNNPQFQSQMPEAARLWGREEAEDIARDGQDFKVSNVRVLAFEVGESVVCRVTLTWNARANGRTVPIKIVDADFLIFGNEDASQTYVKTYNWPSGSEVSDPNGRYNRSLIIDGKTFQQAWDEKRAAQPRNIIEALAGAQNAYNSEAERELRRKGMGPLIDAERARRAALTPEQRATEDAYNRGPAPGETICIQDTGVTRCKTGR